MYFYNRDKADTISPQKYTHHPPFCMLPKGKSGEGAFARIVNLSQLYTPPVSFRIESVVHGHHVHKAVWCPYIEEELLVECEVDNIQDGFAVAILKNSMIVGHVP